MGEAGVKLVWRGRAGLRYFVESKSSLTQSEWVGVDFEIRVKRSGSELTLPLPETEGHFLRVVQLGRISVFVQPPSSARSAGFIPLRLSSSVRVPVTSRTSVLAYGEANLSSRSLCSNALGSENEMRPCNCLERLFTFISR